MLADVPVRCLELRPLLGLRWRMSLTVAAAATIATGAGGHVMLAGALGSWGFFLGALGGFLRARLWFRDARSHDASTPLLLVPAPGIRAGTGVMAAVAVSFTAISVIALGGNRPEADTTVETILWLCAVAGGFDLGTGIAIGGWEARTGYRVARPARVRPRLRGRQLTALAAPGNVRAPSRMPHLMPALCVAGVILAGSSVGALNDPAVHLPPSPAVSRVDATLSGIGAVMAGHPVPVTCWSNAAWQSYQSTSHEQVAGIESGGRIYVEPKACQWLTWMRTTHAWPAGGSSRFWMAQSAGVLTHEIGHVVLGADETNAECYAYTNIGRTLALLGYPHGQAAQLAAIYRTESHPQLPPRYLEHPC